MRTVRLPERIDEILIQEANERGLSPNALVSMILARFVEWDRFANRFHLISVTTELHKGLLDGIDDEKLEYLADKSGSHTPKEAMVFWFKEISVENLVRFLNDSCKYSGYGEFEHQEKQGRNTLTIRHDLGEKWSLYLKRYIDVALRKTFHVTAEFDVTDNAVIATFHS